MRVKKPHSMFFQLCVPILLAVLLVVVCGNALVLSRYEKQFVSAAVQSNREIMRQTSTSLELLHAHLAKVSASLWQNAALRRVLLQPIDDPQQEWRARHILSGIFKEKPAATLDYEITAVGQNGFCATSGNGGVAVPVADMLSSPVFLQSVQTRRVTYTALDTGFTYSTEGSRVIVGCQALLDKALQPYGAVFLTFREADLRRFYQNFIREGNSIYLLSATGQILSSPHSGLVGSSDFALLARSMAALEAGGYLKTTDSQIVMVENLPLYGSYLVSSTNLPVLLSGFYHAQTMVLLVWCVLLLALFAVIGGSIWQALRPLQKLSHHMDASPALPQPIESSAVRELQPLILSYNRMVAKAGEYLERLTRENAKRRQSELDLLQMQINPHFLYNSLGSVKHLVLQNKDADAYKSIDALIALLRSTLNKTDTLVRVEEEIANLQNYITIVAPRYGYMIRAEIHAQGGCLRCKMPNLLLQPLVENAFFHGFQNSKTGRILIFLSLGGEAENELHCEVTDNGDGMQPEQVQQLLHGALPRASASHIGLHNVRERLEMLYPGQSTFRLISEPGYGTSVHISFPATHA